MSVRLIAGVSGQYADLTQLGKVNVDYGPPTELTRTQSASGIPFWGTNPAAWDTFYVNRQPMPGVARVKGMGCKQRHDKKEAAGEHGADITLTGEKPAEFEVVLQLWTDGHIRQLEKLVPLLKPRYPVPPKTKVLGLGDLKELEFQASQPKGFGDLKELEFQKEHPDYTPTPKKSKDTGPKPIDVAHPALKLWGIKSALVVELGLIEVGELGVATLRLKFIEYRGNKRSVQPVAAGSTSITDIKAALQTSPSPADNSGPYSGRGPNERP